MAAAAYTVKIVCRICGTENTITNAKEASGGDNDSYKRNHAMRCDRCGNPFEFYLSSIAVNHTGAVGSNTTITHTIAMGVPTSAVS